MFNPYIHPAKSWRDTITPVFGNLQQRSKTTIVVMTSTLNPSAPEFNVNATFYLEGWYYYRQQYWTQMTTTEPVMSQQSYLMTKVKQDLDQTGGSEYTMTGSRRVPAKPC